MDLAQTGKIVIVAGAALIVLGVIITLAGRLPFLGQLPGDFEIRRGNASIYFPLMTMLVISVVLTVLLNLLLRR